MVSVDFFTVPTIRLRVPYAFVVLVCWRATGGAFYVFASPLTRLQNGLLSSVQHTEEADLRPEVSLIACHPQQGLGARAK
jgi:hypothetical protein